jgi:hypothetical protein
VFPEVGVDLGVAMRAEVLEHKLEDAEERGRGEATWNTRRAPTRLTPCWTNRLWVAVGGEWRGHFPLAGEVLWNPDDETAPYALIFDASRWTEVAPAPAPRFRGWQYLETPPVGGTADRAGFPPPRGDEGK